MATTAHDSQLEEQQQASFFARHRYAFYFLAFLLFTAAIAVSIYFTAGTTIPFIISAGAKVGLNLGFIATLNPPAAIAVTTAVVTGFTLAATATLAIFAKIGQAIYKCCKPSKPDTGPGDAPTEEADHDATNSSTVKMVKRVGGTGPGPQVKEAVKPDKAATIARTESKGDVKAETATNLYPELDDVDTSSPVSYV